MHLAGMQVGMSVCRQTVRCQHMLTRPEDCTLLRACTPNPGAKRVEGISVQAPLLLYRLQAGKLRSQPDPPSSSVLCSR